MVDLTSEEMEAAKMSWQKTLSNWLFQQSIAVVVMVGFVGLQQYQNYLLNQRVQYMEQRVESMLTYEREVLKESLDENTKALQRFETAINQRSR